MLLLENASASNYLDQASPSADWQDYLLGQTATHPLFRRRQLSVVGGKGYVVLTGTVRSFYEKQVAQEFIRRCEGVRHIDNRLDVDYAGERPLSRKGGSP
jgi:osmotically-inducible protein OsmY